MKKLWQCESLELLAEFIRILNISKFGHGIMLSKNNAVAL